MDKEQKMFLEKLDIDLDYLERIMPKFQCSNPDCNDSISIPTSIISSLNWFSKERNIFLCPACLEDYLKSNKKGMKIVN